MIIVGWSQTQYWRFHNMERRSATLYPEPEAEMDLWGIDHSLFDHIRNAKIVTLNIDENLALTSVPSRLEHVFETPKETPAHKT